MEWTLPGTTLTIRREEAPMVDKVFASLFMAGGLSLGQVAAVTGLESYTVQNWVKRGLLSAPVQKKYNRNQLCRIININMLKSILPMERIVGLLGYVNGRLDDTGDDIIDDSQLYFLFVKLAAQARQLDDPAALDQALAQGLADYAEPVAGAKIRVENALRIMLTAWVAARIRFRAEKMLEELPFSPSVPLLE